MQSDIELKNLWNQYSAKLETSLSLNRQHAADITKLKVKSFISSMKPVKIFTIIVGIVWVLLVDSMIAASFTSASIYFLISAIIQVVLTKIAIGMYIYQLVLMQEVDISQPILDTQERIARLKSSTLLVTRILFLQLPVWTTFYLNDAMLSGGHTGWYIMQALITGAFTLAALWLYKNIRYENHHKRWFRVLFNGNEWTPLMKSMDILDQVKDIKED